MLNLIIPGWNSWGEITQAHARTHFSLTRLRNAKYVNNNKKGLPRLADELGLLCYSPL